MILALVARNRKFCRRWRKKCVGRHHLWSFRLSGPVNNVLCFPFIFRGALDVGATAINEEMRKSWRRFRAIAELAHAEQASEVAISYGDQDLSWAEHLSETV